MFQLLVRWSNACRARAGLGQNQGLHWLSPRSSAITTVSASEAGLEAAEPGHGYPGTTQLWPLRSALLLALATARPAQVAPNSSS